MLPLIKSGDLVMGDLVMGVCAVMVLRHATAISPPFQPLKPMQAQWDLVGMQWELAGTRWELTGNSVGVQSG